MNNLVPQAGKESTRWERNLRRGAIALGVAGVAMAALVFPRYGLINQWYTEEKVVSATSPLTKKNEELENAVEGLNNEKNNLMSTLGGVRDSTRRIRVERDRALKDADLQKRAAEGYQTEAQRAESARLALVSSYPIEIRTQDIRYTETTQNNMTVAQLEIVASQTSEPDSLRARYDRRKNVEESYPGLLADAEKRNGRLKLRKIRITEKDKDVYNIRVEYVNGNPEQFTYKHPRLINKEKK